ncbi:MAG: hypothetical protein M3O22_01415 [Pseudomonadota bacterium]|nr:hypothetical protein [Pseudomonadota bacterium]
MKRNQKYATQPVSGLVRGLAAEARWAEITTPLPDRPFLAGMGAAAWLGSVFSLPAAGGFFVYQALESGSTGQAIRAVVGGISAAGLFLGMIAPVFGSRCLADAGQALAVVAASKIQRGLRHFRQD